MADGTDFRAFTPRRIAFRHARLVRRGMELLLVITGLIVFIPGTGDGDADVANLHLALGLVIWAVALNIPGWVAPSRLLSGSVRLRRRHRRVAWRTGTALVFAFTAFLLADAWCQDRSDAADRLSHFARADQLTASAHQMVGLAQLSLALCVVPVVLEPLVWAVGAGRTRRREPRRAGALRPPW